MNNADAKKEIVRYARLLAGTGMVTMYEGNLSVKTETGFVITPSAVNKLTLTEEDLIELDKDGNVRDSGNGRRVSSEYLLHLEAYRVRPDVGACIHFHSTYATAFAVAGKPIEPKGDTTAIVLFGEIPCCRYGRQRTEAIAAELKRYLPDHNAVLLANHGAMVVDKNLEAAAAGAQIVEKTAQIEYLVSRMGGESELPADEIKALNKLK